MMPAKKPKPKAVYAWAWLDGHNRLSERSYPTRIEVVVRHASFEKGKPVRVRLEKVE